MNNIQLGFEVGTGKAISIPLKHMAVTGQTQEAGKTTTLEALIKRSGLKAIAFVTKRGERSFADARRIPPYFREQADWVYVASLIDATLGEKNKILRAWLMKVCRNTNTLADVHKNVKSEKSKAKGFSESIYTEIDGYLDLVVPQIAELPPATGIKLASGLNVMDLSPYSEALQSLVIRSALDWVYENETNIVTIIPEAWEFLPEGRNSPVKKAAEILIRKGASLGNYVWIDSQDMAGVWKLALRACSVWLIGVQREANEIKRTLENIPAGIAKPSKANIAALGLGQFFACWKANVIKTYVQPSWLSEDQARSISLEENAEQFYIQAPSQQISVNSVELENLRADKSRLIAELNEEREKRRNAETKLTTVKAMIAPQYEQMQKIFSEVSVNGNTAPSDVGDYDIWLRKFGGSKKKILEIFIQRGRLTKQQAQILSGLSRDTIRIYLNEFKRANLIKQEGGEFILQKP